MSIKVIPEHSHSWDSSYNNEGAILPDYENTCLIVSRVGLFVSHVDDDRRLCLRVTGRVRRHCALKVMKCQDRASPSPAINNP